MEEAFLRSENLLKKSSRKINYVLYYNYSNVIVIRNLIGLMRGETMKTENRNNFCIFASALDFIENNLCSEFTQEQIAASCYCSLSALQKLWRYSTHTSLKEYISKRRLTNAGADLLNTDMTVLEVALKYQYNSHEVFTRAFTKQWGVSPSAFKKQWNKSCGLFPKLNKDYLEGADYMGNKKFDVTELFDFLKERTGTYVLCFDIAGLDAVNRNIGREAGDKAILESLKRINEAAQDDMPVLRIGGDEFVMVTGLDDVELVKDIAQKVLSHNGEEVAYSGGALPVSLRSGAVQIRKPLKYSSICKDFDEVIGCARNDGEVHFVNG